MRKISIIMTVYNAESYLEYSVPSVLNQKYENFELIIINDGSTDNSKSILESFNDDRIKLSHQSNRGKSSALNAGLNLVSGDYITIIDHDDYFHESYISNAFQDIDWNVPDVIMTTLEILEPSGYSKANIRLTKSLPIYLYGQEILDAHLSDRSINIFLSNKIFKSSIFDVFRFNEEYILDDLSSCYLLLSVCSSAARVYNSYYYHVKQKNSLSRMNNNSIQYVTQLLEIYYNRFVFIEVSYSENKYLRKLILELSLLTILYCLVRLQAKNIEVDNEQIYTDFVENNIDEYLVSKSFFHKFMTKILLFISKKKLSPTQNSIELVIKKLIVRFNLIYKKWRSS